MSERTERHVTTMFQEDITVNHDVTTSAMRQSEPYCRYSLLGTLAIYISLLCRTPFVKTVYNC